MRIRRPGNWSLVGRLVCASEHGPPQGLLLLQPRGIWCTESTGVLSSSRGSHLWPLTFDTFFALHSRQAVTALSLIKKRKRIFLHL